MESVLFLLAGLPGTGKTFLSNIIRQEMGEFDLVSPDELKEKYWAKYGYDNLEEKNKLTELAWSEYYSIVEEKMREKKIILSDYPFSQKQKPILKHLVEQYKYKVITIRLIADLDVLFERQKIRDLDTSRHLSHIMTNYHKGDILKNRKKADNLLTYEEFISRCTTRGYDTFEMGSVYEIDVTDYAKIDYPLLLKKIKKECLQGANSSLF